MQIPIVRVESSCSPGVRIFYVPLFLVTKATHVRFGWICAVPRISADRTKKRNKRKWERTHWDRANYKYFYFIIIGIRCHVPHAEQIICFHLAHFLQCFAGWLFSTRFKSLWDCKTAAMLLYNNKKREKNIFRAGLHQLNDIDWQNHAVSVCMLLSETPTLVADPIYRFSLWLFDTVSVDPFPTRKQHQTKQYFLIHC